MSIARRKNISLFMPIHHGLWYRKNDNFPWRWSQWLLLVTSIFWTNYQFFSKNCEIFLCAGQRRILLVTSFDCFPAFLVTRNFLWSGNNQFNLVRRLPDAKIFHCIAYVLRFVNAFFFLWQVITEIKILLIEKKLKIESRY